MSSSYFEFTTRKDLRNWLVANSKTETECWLVMSISIQTDTLLYLDIVEEALCFGWIDGVKKKLPDNRLIQRISPRSKRSNWTELNKARVRRLEALGLMTTAGRAVLPEMDPNLFEWDARIVEALQQDDVVYQNFRTFPILYQTIRIDTIQSYKKDTELFNKRLEKLIKYTKANKMYGSWHDNGRLLDDNQKHFLDTTTKKLK
ncbi:YdeI/OmpD-associated family protein [Brochothrix thermosphacta]|uniref:YdeI/OmpD-associated family protein n=1 Tax=Brochothrix thermosphacta TaxID=2756 RepID=UPI00083F7834|nr:YdeI/OmpD-associated family protein [Brochothrix thermosphacta]ODJ56138.1 thymidylate synthase [Brochothrix thermosphacta]ODJ71139.1 thymidylate synthase [Brochothrix thermosphacta]